MAQQFTSKYASDIVVPLLASVTTMNANDDPLALGANEVADAAGFELSSGVLTAIAANSNYSDYFNPPHREVQGMKWLVLNDVEYLWVAYGGKLYWIESDGSIHEVANPGPVYPTLNTTGQIAIESIGNLIIASDGVNDPICWDGSSWKTITPVAYPVPATSKLENDWLITKTWPLELVPCIDNAGCADYALTTGRTSPTNRGFDRYYDPQHYLNVWQWSDSATFTDITVGGPISISLYDANDDPNPNAFTIIDTTPRQYGSVFPIGACVRVSGKIGTTNVYFRGHVINTVPLGNNKTIVYLEEDCFRTLGAITSLTQGKASAKGLGGVYANDNNFCMMTQPHSYLTISSTYNVARNVHDTYSVIISGTGLKLVTGDYIQIRNPVDGTVEGYILSVSEFAGKTYIWFYVDNEWTYVTPSWTTGKWHVRLARRGPDNNFRMSRIRINGYAPVGSFIECYLDNDGATTTARGFKLDLSKSYQLAFRTTKTADLSLLSGGYIKVGLKDSVGNIVYYDAFGSTDDGEWFYIITRYDSSGSLVEDSFLSDIVAVRFEVANQVPLEGSPTKYYSIPIYGMRATGVVPYSATYAARFARTGPDGSVIGRSAVSYYELPYRPEERTAYINTYYPLRCPQGTEVSDLTFTYRITAYDGAVNNKIGVDRTAEFQLFRSDGPSGDYRFVNSWVPDNSSRDDELPTIELIKNDLIGSPTEITLPRPSVMFKHLGRLWCANCQTYDFENETWTDLPLAVFASSVEQYLTFDSVLNLLSGEANDAVYFTLYSEYHQDEAIAGSTIVGNGDGACVLFTRAKTFSIIGQHPLNFTVTLMNEVGIIGPNSFGSYRGLIFFVGADRNLWVVAQGLNRILSYKVSPLIIPYEDEEDISTSLCVGNDRVYVSILAGKNTNGQEVTSLESYTLVGDIRLTNQGSEVQWTRSYPGNMYYPIMVRHPLRRNDLSGESEVYAFMLAGDSNLLGRTASVVKLYDDKNATSGKTRLVTREFSMLGQTWKDMRILVMCSKNVGEVQMTVTLKSEYGTHAFQSNIPGYVPGESRVHCVSRPIMSPKEIGRVLSLQIETSEVDVGWKLYGANLILTPVDTHARWSTVEGRV